MSAKRKAPTPAGGRKARPTGKAKPKQSRKRKVLKVLLLTGLFGILLGGAAFAYGYASTEIPDPNKDFQTQTTFIYYADGKTELGRFATQDRQSIPLADMPQHVQDAVIAAENRSFWTDRGIDPKGILRAAFSNATNESTQGASTITQQYVKVLYLTQDRTLTRKVKEAFLSLKIQQEISKAEILEGYLNTIYFGRGAYGIQAAAEAYFEKDAKDLTVREGAALASILNSPGNLDPAEGREARERLQARYAYVLDGMADMESVSQTEADKAAQSLPKFPTIKVEDRFGGPKGHLLALVKQQLRAEGFSDADIEGGGLRVTTTFTRKAQRAAVRAVKEERPKENARGVNIGLAAVDPATGALRAMYGGADYVKSQRNWATTGRQPGSTFKPFALAAGLQDDISLFDVFTGNTYTFPDGNTVDNENGDQYGPVNMLTATENSINTAYVDLTMSMENGPEKVIKAAVKAGIPKDAPGLNPVPTITLGTADIKPVDMANAQSTFANEGRSHDWFAVRKVNDASGEELFEQKIKTERAFPADLTSNVVEAMQKVVASGTGTAAQEFGCPVAGKTGTANLRPKDGSAVTSAWFTGYSPRLSASVMYVRGDSGTKNLDGVGGETDFFGGAYPARTFTAFMEKALAGKECAEFPEVDYVNGSPAPSPEPTTRAPEPSNTPSEEPTTESPTPTPTKTEEPEPTPTPEPEPTPTEPIPSPSDGCTDTVEVTCPPGGGNGNNDNGP